MQGKSPLQRLLIKRLLRLILPNLLPLKLSPLRIVLLSMNYFTRNSKKRKVLFAGFLLNNEKSLIFFAK
ncbi:predicted protein [Enterococcus faecalis ATCC 4200]|nr:predicted protein [Enterococcus faecalis ATCC 4200]EEU72090.1 predicted protein [Enterococcus faecalis HIP11704]